MNTDNTFLTLMVELDKIVYNLLADQVEETSLRDTGNGYSYLIKLK